ncbi:pentapeptide repeat-containing protein [Corynebacterium qintianiae]|uniref:Pentapeptide repeat-containing protein n=1 Tax=Corynebacterium qintianiae TaxID=2709392 RepID=A0A7T0KL48_9CORY|nr:pentapeptide repeat-containing protein [Corynebacterium qintianiae]QPK82522.1 pentapeptide repeat-containing protein [Corynebacterium qintianiae]
MKKENFLLLLALSLIGVSLVVTLVVQGIEKGATVVAALFTTAGVIFSVWAAQIRSIDQQNREDSRQYQRLVQEQTIAREERDNQRELDREQRDSNSKALILQMSTQQRIEMSKRRDSATTKLLGDNGLERAAAINDLFFQIDDWWTLIDNEISLSEGEEKIRQLRQEGRRRRQELFDLALKIADENELVLEARARNLRARLAGDVNPSSLADLDMRGLNLASPVTGGRTPDLSGAQFPRGIDLSHSNFTGCLLNNATFEGAKLYKASFARCELTESNFQDARGTECSFQNALIQTANFRESHFWKANFDDAIVVGDFSNSNLKASSFRRSRIAASSFSKADLGAVDFGLSEIALPNFSETWLAFSNFGGARIVGGNLRGAKFGFSTMKNAVFADPAMPSENSDSWMLEEDDATDWTGVNLEEVDFRAVKLRSRKHFTKNSVHYKRSLADFRPEQNYPRSPNIFDSAK